MNLKEVLEKQLERIKLDEEEYSHLVNKAQAIKEELEEEIKKIKAEVFIGGSLAKGTLIKKEKYDVDIYVRFEKEGDLEKLGEIIKKTKLKANKTHGSRDYFQIPDKKVIFEIIPVIKINNPSKARNVTDLSWFHVKYVSDKIKKNPRLKKEIILAKSFCYASGCYGAESYIRGFSGYAIELLVIHFGSFEKFLKEINKDRIVITSGFYKNEKEALMNINEAKLSPVVFLDPTFKERNILAALSQETFDKFKKISRDFIKNPSLKFFETKEIDKSKFKIKIEIKTDRQEGDIAGTKLKKFYEMFSLELERFFKIKNKDFAYLGKKKALMLFNLDKKEIILKGPPIIRMGNVVEFKKRHKNVFIKNNVVYAREKAINFHQFLKKFRAENKKKMKEMGILALE